MRSEGELAKIVHQSHLYYTGVGRGEHYVRNKKYYIYFMFFFIFILLYIYIVYYYILFLIFLLGHSEFIVFGLFSFSHFINPINSVLNQDVNLCGPQLPTWPFREFFFLCTPISFLEGVIYRAQGEIRSHSGPSSAKFWSNLGIFQTARAFQNRPKWRPNFWPNFAPKQGQFFDIHPNPIPKIQAAVTSRVGLDGRD